jgi:hypothetical protein
MDPEKAKTYERMEHTSGEVRQTFPYSNAAFFLPLKVNPPIYYISIITVREEICFYTQ